MNWDNIKLHAKNRAFSCPFCFTLLDIDKITIRETTPVLRESGLDPEKYHLMRQKERELLFTNIIKDKPSSDLYFCSIGSGFAGEEYLIKDRAKNLTLIEPDHFAADFLRKKFGADANTNECLYQSYQPHEKFDVIYTSGLGSWMMANPFLGVERDLLEFCRNYLKDDGIFIALIYGGLHEPGYFLNKKYYIDRLTASLTTYNLNVLLYGKYNPHAAILVAGRQPSTNVENIKKFAKEILVEYGRMIPQPGNIFKNYYNFTIGCAWNLLYMFKKISIVLRETIKIIKINAELIN
jgi:SAM-dependent methyltransferase